MDSFLLWIGLYNLLAPLLFVPMIFSSGFADFVLRRATEVIAEPYEPAPYGGVWFLWIATTNGALGALMVLARGWPVLAQQQVTLVVFAIYFVFWLAMAAFARGPRWGRGIWIVHGLWIAQMAWAGWALHDTGWI